MKSDYTTNSCYITHTIAFWKVGRIHFLSSGVKGLNESTLLLFTRVHFRPGKKLFSVILAASEALIAAEGKLNELDNVAGDGDCGTTMKRGAAGEYHEWEILTQRSR